jgi:hypothetical protein
LIDIFFATPMRRTADSRVDAQRRGGFDEAHRRVDQRANAREIATKLQ